MGKALVLKNVDFSAVKVATVTLIEEVPCKAVSLSPSSLSFDTVGETKSLTASLTPSNTTDTLSWASSNTNVATVDQSGNVTIHGIGSATITATCGNASATLTITSSSLKAPYALKKVTNKYPGTLSVTGGSILVIDSNTSQYVVGQEYHSGNKHLHLVGGDSNEVECVSVPYGATKVKIKTTDDVAVSISYTYVVDATTQLTYNDVEYAKYLRDQTFVNTNTGYDVEYGEAVVFRPVSSQADTLDYIYFT